MRTSLVRNPFISPEIIDPKFVINMPVDAIASSRLIYATTLFRGNAASFTCSKMCRPIFLASINVNQPLWAFSRSSMCAGSS
ncbi:MAG: hypothetical protein VB140_07665 [Burkholderia sp.]